MIQYNTFLFDLDGTLTDPQEGIINSIQYALTRLGLEEHDKAELIDFIGPPLLGSFRKRYGLSDQRARQAIVYYREYFSEKGIFENRLYDGIEALVSALSERSCRLAVGTSKPTLYAKRILEHFGLSQYFDIVVGSKMNLTRTSKNEVIKELLRTFDVTRDSCLMIGDRADDILAARAHTIDSVGVGYGYGSEVEFNVTKPTYLVHTVDELSLLLLGFAER